MRITDELMEPYGLEEDHINFPGYKFPRFKQESQLVRSIEFKTTKAMIDVNEHVHNPAYLDYAEEVFPDDLVKHHFSVVDVEYRAEVKPGEAVTVEHRVDEAGAQLVKVLDGEGQLHASLMFSDTAAAQ